MDSEHSLPIKEAKKALLYSLDNNDVVILTAETGSGKTTQIPKYLIEAGYIINNKQIAVTVPRRIAALSIAKRVSEQLGCYNHQIAHHVRFNSTVNENTRVVFMTDGMLVQELYSDPLLNSYSIVMLDDIHEKSINCEILFGFVKKILHKRKDFKLLITSATLQVHKIEAFFRTKSDYREDRDLRIKTINVPGRFHEVKINYLREHTKNYFLKMFQTIVYIDRETASGNILVFLTSVEEIEGMATMLDSYIYQNKKRMKIMPLHAGLGLEKQVEIFQFSRDRKVILATNIAESSITIPDIKYVVDCGYVKVKAYDLEKGVEKMIVVPCGKSSAVQRAGRAGRVFDGQCFRIYTQDSYTAMAEKVLPEIMRIDLSSFLLKLLGLGIKNLLSFQLLDKPPDRHYSSAIDMLYAYDLINDNLQLTSKGLKAAELSLDIRSSSMLLNSFDPKFGCSKQILILVCMLEVHRDLFTNNSLAQLKAKKKIGVKQGDFLTLINIYLRYSRAKGQQRRRICGELKLSYNTMEQVLKIHDQLLLQIKGFNKKITQQQKMLAKYDNNFQEVQEPFILKSSSDQYQAILRCILTGYFTNIAQLQGDGTYINIRSKQKLQLHPTSILSTVYPQWIVYHEIVKSSHYYIHNGSKIEVDWIFELVGHYYKDMRKEIASDRYEQDKSKKIEDYKPIEKAIEKETKGLIQVGGKQSKPEIFKTSVLGLKTMKKNKLSFQEQFDI